jgi:hypothetical protein
MLVLCGVAKACDTAPGPLRAEVLTPRRAAFDDGDRAVIDLGFDADLIQCVWRDALLAIVARAGSPAGSRRFPAARSP